MGKEYRTLGFLASPIEDRRLPAPDVMGVLADYQVRKPQLDEIAREVDENWPGVCAVFAGHFSSHNETYFAIHIDPFSKDLQRQHWPLRDKIQSIINNNSFSFFYLPKCEDNPYSSEIVVYRKK